ncbi:MAG TPA: ribosome recycling factor [Candidatus Saccharimonadales bacterium]|nr:ribosome recycling factor [Candidatus Saccharimonadales bacterium]
MDETQVKQKMQGAVDALLSVIGTIRTGRATPNLIQNLEVMVYGGAQKLRILEVASVTTPDPQSLVIDPWDKSIIGEIKKGIEAANVGMNPNIDGEIIRISVPPLTTEDREKFVKLLSGKLEEARVHVRQIRADVMHGIKKEFDDGKITEDEKFSFEKNLQTLTDTFVGKIEEIGNSKKQELMQL